ncbi:uncharacterized protein KGF55_003228 [Candida pseudojiufengensis]|uniref:uncharacterized protein n=1 Tax=Candida pseudojiufengensis TaxID=497109 RepID=UPI002224D2BF|nr:uncharacterized protein KGF55_003228 [Candida pseudojiufengensis]KAI5962152.1 hypothetical protein KGF55_003228 [Candida pseudojiufengensis]
MKFFTIAVAAFVACTEAAAIYTPVGNSVQVKVKKDAEPITSFKGPSTNAVLFERGFPNITIPIEQLNKAIADLLSGNIIGSAVDFAELLATLGIDAVQAAEFGLHEGETLLGFVAQLGSIITHEASALQSATKRDKVDISTRDFPNITIPIELLNKAISDLLNYNIVGSAIDFGQLLATLGIDAAEAAAFGLQEGGTLLGYVAQLGSIITHEASLLQLRKRDSFPDINIPVELLNQAISELLNGSFGSSVIDFGKLLATLGIDAVQAAEFGLHEGETLLQYVGQLGQIIASVSGILKRDSFPDVNIPVAQLNQAIADLLNGDFGTSVIDFAKLLATLGIDAAQAAAFGLQEGGTLLGYVGQIARIIASLVGA